MSYDSFARKATIFLFIVISAIISISFSGALFLILGKFTSLLYPLSLFHVFLFFLTVICVFCLCIALSRPFFTTTSIPHSDNTGVRSKFLKGTCDISDSIYIGGKDIRTLFGGLQGRNISIVLYLKDE